MHSANRLVRLFCAAVAALCGTCGAQTVVYVNGAAPSPGDGTSWVTAHKYLSAALADGAARADLGETVQVWIAAGTYLPDQSVSNPAGGLDDNATFNLHNSVSLYGGFTGTETSLDQANPAGNIVDLHGFGRDPGDYLGTRHVITGVGVNASVTIDGVTITNLRKNSGDGKAANLLTSSPAFRRCTLRDITNQSHRAAGIYTSGGAPVFEDCTFLRNRAGAPDVHGGAIYCTGGALTVRRSVFDSNRADGNGGAIYFESGGPALIEDCTFIKNYTNDMSGGAMWLAANSTVRRCTFQENSAYYSVGALETAGLVEDSVFVGNTANSSSSSQGGAARGAGTFRNCLFWKNRASNGGALSGQTTSINCIFVGNRADYGGAAFNGGTYANCIFSGNTVSNSQSGIVDATSGTSVTLVNCSFSANSGRDLRCGPGPVSVRNTIFYKTPSSSPTESSHITGAPAGSVRNSYFQSLVVTYAGNGNLGGSPLISPRFADPNGPDAIAGTPDDDLRLRAGSPCIDAGDNTAVPVGVTLDASGAARFVDDPGMADVGVGAAPLVDMGAYEFAGTSCAADFNDDGFLDPLDYNLFINAFEAGDISADFSRDGFVDPLDYNQFINAFEAGC